MANVHAISTFTTKAITIAPPTINGERSNRRSAMFNPFCTRFISLVNRVSKVSFPSASSCEKLKYWIFEKSDCLTSAVNPVAAFAAKYWAVIDTATPTIPSPIRIAPCWRISAVSLFSIPLSIMTAMISGTNNSRIASNNLNKGANIVSFRYGFK